MEVKPRPISRHKQKTNTMHGTTGKKVPPAHAQRLFASTHGPVLGLAARD
jgi:hypothetical protein